MRAFGNIELEVFELIDKEPVLKYKMIVENGIILAIWNKGIEGQRGKLIEKIDVKKYFSARPIDPIELLDISGQLNYKFDINKLGWRNLYLNLSKNDQIILGLIEKPKSFWIKLIDFSVRFYRLFLSVIGIAALVLGVITDGFGLLDRKKENQQTKEHTTKTDTSLILDRFINSRDSTDISYNDSLHLYLKD